MICTYICSQGCIEYGRGWGLAKTECLSHNSINILYVLFYSYSQIHFRTVCQPHTFYSTYIK